MFHMLNTINKLTGHPWAVLPFPLNFVSKWDVSETRQGQTGLSFMTCVGGACPLWACMPMKDQWPITSMIVTWWIFNQWWPTPKNGHRSTAPSLYQTPHSFHKIFQYFSSAYKIMISLHCQMSGILFCVKKWCKPVYFISKKTNWFFNHGLVGLHFTFIYPESVI